jgi:hypothetical protein
MSAGVLVHAEKYVRSAAAEAPHRQTSTPFGNAAARPALQRNQNWYTLSHCIQVDATIRKRLPSRACLGTVILVSL